MIFIPIQDHQAQITGHKAPPQGEVPGKLYPLCLPLAVPQVCNLEDLVTFAKVLASAMESQWAAAGELLSHRDWC